MLSNKGFDLWADGYDSSVGLSDDENSYPFAGYKSVLGIIYRAIMENTAMIAKGHMDLVYEATGNRPSEVVFAGGASKGDIWCQIVSDVLGLPVKVPVVKEATALGAAILAGYGVGVYSDISEASRRLVKWDKVFTPNMENHKVYEEMYATWRKVYDAQLSLSDEGTTRYMWVAPGLQ